MVWETQIDTTNKQYLQHLHSESRFRKSWIFMYSHNKKKLNKMSDYQSKPFGFERTQMWKEWEQPQIIRSTALTSALKFFEMNLIGCTPKELQSLTNGFLIYIQTGDISIFARLQEYLEQKEKDAKESIDVPVSP